MLINHKKHKSHKLCFCAFCGHSRKTSRCRILQNTQLVNQLIGVHSCPFVVRLSPSWVSALTIHGELVLAEATIL